MNWREIIVDMAMNLHWSPGDLELREWDEIILWHEAALKVSKGREGNGQ